MKQHVTDKMLDEVIDIYLTETENFSLLDKPPIFVSEDAEDAQDIKWIKSSSSSRNTLLWLWPAFDIFIVCLTEGET